MQPSSRSATVEERELVVWLLQKAATISDVAAFFDQVSHLRVVGGCGCGCPSVDFKAGGQDAVASIIADAEGTSPEGVMVGVMLWVKEGRISGLEVYPFADTGRFGLPRPNDLKPTFGPDAV